MPERNPFLDVEGDEATSPDQRGVDISMNDWLRMASDLEEDDAETRDMPTGGAGPAAVPNSELEASSGSAKSVAFAPTVVGDGDTGRGGEAEVVDVLGESRGGGVATAAAAAANHRPPPPPPRGRGHQRSRSAGGVLGLTIPASPEEWSRLTAPSSSDGDVPPHRDSDDPAVSLYRRPSNMTTESEIEYFRKRRSEGKSAAEMQSAIARLRRRNRAMQDGNALMQHELSRVKANRLHLERVLSEQIQQAQ
mmetsp:Transcript_28391/g.74571  ORF Transcript_28391/g.74571 Transcript_28391/m.74571 type:complete len:250 (+) Transcript_28391:239-988(+)